MARTTIPEIRGLPDRYDARRYIARTAYGDVVEAFNRDRNMAVALKLLHADGSRADIARAMFRREVEALKGLSHEAIVQILDSFECEEGLLCIELELIPGGRSLSKLFEEVQIGRLQAPTPEWRVRMSACLAEAVLEAHRRNVIHRDIKPGNVLWNRDEDVLKLADFGIAAVLPLTVRDPSGMTLRSFYTRPWASPEQLLQKAPGSPSDVYAFGLLVASLLTLREPEETFEPGHLEGFMEPAIRTLAEEGVSAFDVEDLATTLKGALLDDPAERPSLTQIRDVLARLQTILVPRPEAAFVLTLKARKRLEDAGFVADAKIAEDFNSDLRVRLERDDRGERIKLFGRSLFAVLVLDEDDDDHETICAVDAGQNPGPQHESHRRSAKDCPIRLRIGRGSSTALREFAREAEREATRRATSEIVERARLIVEIERERLPVFVIEATVEGGQRVGDHREEQIGRASGYQSAQSERVEVNGGFRLRVLDAFAAPNTALKNLVRSRLEAGGIELEEAELLDDNSSAEWYAMFDDPKDIDILDEHGHIVGKVTGYEPESNTLHVRTDKKRRVLLVGRFLVKNQQKERQLRQQELAIDALSRGETARADMPHLLSEAAVHHMGEKPWVNLMQSGLTPESRVKDLVNRILASQTAFCLQGPPGTGKTTIIAEVVAQTLELEPRSRILVCAQANDAVANAIERVLKVRHQISRDWIVVRDVRAERAREEGPWSGYDAAYREFASRIRGGAAAGAESSSAAAREALTEWVQCVEHGSRQVGRDHHGLVQVWGTTTARSTKPLDKLEGEAYDLVIVDEAAKATVGEVLVPVVRARRLLLVGDQKQLPPFLEDTTLQALQELGVSEEEAKYSLFEHLFRLVPPSHRDMLDVQFRMHPSIGDVVSRLFYEGKVRSGPGSDRRPLPPGDFDRAHRVMWIDVVGKDFKVGRTSRANDAERQVILRLLSKLDSDASRAGVHLEVVVIAAYRGQADKLQAEVRAAARSWPSLRVKAATVDAFQGREADVVLYSLVRTGDAERRFIADGRRFNVALSRARSLLVLVGDRTGARGTTRLQQLLDMIPAENQVLADRFVPATPKGAALPARPAKPAMRKP